MINHPKCAKKYHNQTKVSIYIFYNIYRFIICSMELCEQDASVEYYIQTRRKTEINGIIHSKVDFS